MHFQQVFFDWYISSNSTFDYNCGFYWNCWAKNLKNDSNAPSELIWTSFSSPRQTSVVISSTGVSTTATNTSGNDRRPRNASLGKPLTLFRSFILYSSQMAKGKSTQCNKGILGNKYFWNFAIGNFFTCLDRNLIF